MYHYILILGSNIQPKLTFLQEAIQNIGDNSNITIQKKTEILQTEPVLNKKQDIFLNQGIKIQTSLEPLDLLSILKHIEKKVGRIRRRQYASREIDIDIVWWSAGNFKHKELTIPHEYNYARFWVRKFIANLTQVSDNAYSQYHTMDTLPISTVQDFILKKKQKEPITMVTCYDYSYAHILSHSSIDVVLVGDSLGNVIQGHEDTLQVTLKNIVYHTQCVRKGLPDTFLIADMPFLSYKISEREALINAGKVIQQTKCNAIKIEGADESHLPYIKKIVDAGIPVMGHLGLETQKTLSIGGYKLQKKNSKETNDLIKQAKRLEDIGCFALVLEMLQEEVAFQVSSSISIPTIGIGSGNKVDGQVLVLQDLLGFNTNFNPKFVRKFSNTYKNTLQAVEAYCNAVRTKDFPNKNETFH